MLLLNNVEKLAYAVGGANLNTSYVTVKPCNITTIIIMEIYLNTSYVTVKPPYFTHSTFI